jgi:hypothetical protein
MLASLAIFFVVTAELRTHAEQNSSQAETAHDTEAHSKGESAHDVLAELFSNETAHNGDDEDAFGGGALPSLHQALLHAHSSLGDVLHMGLSTPITAHSTPQEAEVVAMKFTKMLEMFALMHQVVKPVKKELQSTLENLEDGKARQHTEFLLEHVKDLDKQSIQVNSLLAALRNAHTHEEKHTAMHNLLHGVVSMKNDLLDNLMSLKEAIHPVTHKPSPFMKMRVVLHKLAKKIKKELTDPKLKESKQVQLDVRMYSTVKDAVTKAETLIAAGSLALKKEPSKHMEMAIHRVMKRRMGMVTADLRKEMDKIKTEREALKKEEGKADTKSEKQLRQHGVPLPDPAVEE